MAIREWDVDYLRVCGLGRIGSASMLQWQIVLLHAGKDYIWKTYLELWCYLTFEKNANSSSRAKIGCLKKFGYLEKSIKNKIEG